MWAHSGDTVPGKDNEHAAHLKNRYMVGGDGRTPTERLRGRGVQRPVYELGEKVLFVLPDEETLAQGSTWDPNGLQIIRWRGVRWNTLRSDQMQDSATAQCSGEMGHRIRAEHQRNPVVFRRRACWRCQHPCGSP